ncbi:MAG: hypothetical protein MJZ41_08600 [Bacteroidaceae bacterium]|nr:hypothetical protein [Bacteroidaceae bacterium]
MNNSLIDSKSGIDKMKQMVDTVSDMYKHSSPEQRNNIIKAGAGALGLIGFFAFLKSL